VKVPIWINQSTRKCVNILALANESETGMQRPMNGKDRKSMKSPQIENIVVDEVHDLTYVVMAHKVLNDGELYSAIRVEILKRGSFPTKGERLVITAPNVR
jgi:hypothetical protein